MDRVFFVWLVALVKMRSESVGWLASNLAAKKQPYRRTAITLYNCGKRRGGMRPPKMIQYRREKRRESNYDRK